jgi:hypothetical protein
MVERGCGADQLTPLQVELLEEKTAALLRISRTLGELVAELRRERAELWSWYLRVQRDAIGIRRHEGLEELYPLPPPLDG